MISFSKTAMKGLKANKFMSSTKKPASMMAQAGVRNFGAMDEVNTDLFMHSFTDDMSFKSSFDKFKCFRVIDEEGQVVTPGYDTAISDDLIMKMYDKMVMINEADTVYNAAQRQARISFYMT